MKKGYRYIFWIATAIIATTIFQWYWLKDNYERERRSLDLKASGLFSETIVRLQDSITKAHFHDNFLSGLALDSLILQEVIARIEVLGKGEIAHSWKISRDSSAPDNDTSSPPAVQLSTTISEVIPDSLLQQEFSKALRARELPAELRIFKLPSDTTNPNLSFASISSPNARYQFRLLNPSPYLLKKITVPILFSVALILLTLAAFTVLYRNLRKQQRLSQQKNDFISNITHELKTPISTVTVAMEALRNFNALDNAERTREYIDISASEMQRLRLLTDKVLKLSLFESDRIALQKERFDLLQLVEDVMRTMQLQFEKNGAATSLSANGAPFLLEADKLHIASVVYNLLDNALKYGGTPPGINIALEKSGRHIVLKVSDNGTGIPMEYRKKIFEKFFRVPTGDRHNTKGYGLGLSYVHHIVQKHEGSIQVESGPGKGSTFIVRLPAITPNTPS